jgi:hypothetical protein
MKAEDELRIKSISEAYSREPILLMVCTKEMDYSVFPDNNKPHVHSSNCIQKIELSGNSYYATNFKDEVLHKFVYDSVNVSFFTQE